MPGPPLYSIENYVCISSDHPTPRFLSMRMAALAMIVHRLQLVYQLFLASDLRITSTLYFLRARLILLTIQ